MAVIKCDTCPWSKDTYPGQLKHDVPFRICGMSGNIVYPVPHKEKRYSGPGYIHFGISSCGIFETAEDVLAAMTDIERKRYKERMERNEGDRDQHQSGMG